MITVEVLNLENLVPVELVSAINEDAMLQVMWDIVSRARAHWIKLASQKFHTTKTEYIGGIEEVEWRSKDTAVIALVGVLPNILEHGLGEMNMRDTMLGPNVPVGARGEKGTKHPRAEGGYYRAIPFRHYTPGAGAHGIVMGQAMAKLLGEEYSKKIGDAIYGAAKRLKGSLTDPYTNKTTWGDRLNAPRMEALQRRHQIHIPKLSPYHATDPYSGMVRMSKTYKKKTQSQYKTFRTISQGPSGEPIGTARWIRHSTEPGAQLAQKVSEYVGTRLAPMAFQAYVNSIK